MDDAPGRNVSTSSEHHSPTQQVDDTRWRGNNNPPKQCSYGHCAKKSKVAPNWKSPQAQNPHCYSPGEPILANPNKGNRFTPVKNTGMSQNLKKITKWGLRFWDLGRPMTIEHNWRARLRKDWGTYVITAYVELLLKSVSDETFCWVIAIYCFRDCTWPFLFNLWRFFL